MEEKYQISNNIITQIVEDNILILEKTGKNIILLNNTATKIFKYIDMGNSRSEIVNMLKKEYWDENDSIENDVLSIFQYFIEKGIIGCSSQ